MSEHLKNKQKAELNQSTDNDQNNMLIAAGSKGEGQEESEPLLDEEKNMTDLEGKREDDVDLFITHSFIHSTAHYFIVLDTKFYLIIYYLLFTIFYTSMPTLAFLYF